MEKALEEAWVGPQVWLNKVSGNHQNQRLTGGVNSVIKIDGDSDMVAYIYMLGWGKASLG